MVPFLHTRPGSTGFPMSQGGPALKIRESFWKTWLQLGASDSAHQVGNTATWRVCMACPDATRFSSHRVPHEIAEVARQILTPAQREEFETTREVDFAFGVAGLARFRANFFVQRSSVSMVFRHVANGHSSTSRVARTCPPVLEAAVVASSVVLILVTGTTGSGKSTTLAAMINARQSTRCRSTSSPSRIPSSSCIAINAALVQQREVGTDTSSFHEASASRSPPGSRCHHDR